MVPDAKQQLLAIITVHRSSPRGEMSEYRAVLAGKHDPDGARRLGVGIDPHSGRQPHLVTTTTHYLVTERRPVRSQKGCHLPLSQNTVKCETECHSAPPSLQPSLPHAGGERPAGIAVREVDGEALEGVAVGYCPPHCVLELLVPTGHPCAALQLVGRQRSRQQVGQLVVPRCGHTQVLETGEYLSGGVCLVLPV